MANAVSGDPSRHGREDDRAGEVCQEVLRRRGVRRFFAFREFSFALDLKSEIKKGIILQNV